MNWLLIPVAACALVIGIRLGRRSAFDQMSGRPNRWYMGAL